MHRRNGKCRRRGHCDCWPKRRVFDHGTEARNRRNLPPVGELAAEEEIRRFGNGNGKMHSRRLLARQLSPVRPRRRGPSVPNRLAVPFPSWQEALPCSGGQQVGTGGPSGETWPLLVEDCELGKANLDLPVGSAPKRVSNRRASSARSLLGNSVAGACRFGAIQSPCPAL